MRISTSPSRPAGSHPERNREGRTYALLAQCRARHLYTVSLLLTDYLLHTGGMVDADNKLILETLKKIQAGIVELRNGQVDLRRDVSTIKDEIVSLRTIMGEFIKTDARREGDLSAFGRSR